MLCCDFSYPNFALQTVYMQGFFNPTSANFLGGSNVHHIVMIGLLTAIVIKVYKK